MDTPTLLLVVWAVAASLIALAFIIEVIRRNKSHQQAANEASTTIADLRAKLVRFGRITDIEDARTRLEQQMEVSRQAKLAEIEALKKAIGEKQIIDQDLEREIQQRRLELEKVNETLDLQSFGFYQSRYDLSTPEAYKNRLEQVRWRQKAMLQDRVAASTVGEWTVNGSRREGQKQINQVLKLMLRAFNGECDAAVAKVSYSNVNVMEERINKAFAGINKLATVQMCSISPQYLSEKLEELHLTHEYREKLQQAKEEQREIRARMREDEIARREIAKALETAGRDEERYSEALEVARMEVAAAEGAKQAKLLTHIANLERKLAEAMVLKERALSRAQLTRSGHVYVISNLGSFGENVYKIGMTRRLDPQDRVIELGDASVPFRFDVHAIIYCDDAPTLETQLHRKFHDRRVNRVNFRKEFFHVSLDEVAAAVKEFHGEIEFTLLAEAEEYRKTLSAIGAGKIGQFDETVYADDALSELAA